MKYIDRLCGKSDFCVLTICIFLVGAVGLLDYATGAEISISILYLIPVVLAGWAIGRRAGVFISVLSAVAWFLADHATSFGYSHPAIPYWNAGVSLGFSLLVTYGLTALKASLAMQDQLSQFIVHDLRSPLTNVLTGLQTLEVIGRQDLSPDAKELVEMGIISSNRMLSLINSLLDVPKMEGGRMPIRQEEIQAAEVVEESFRQVRSWAAQNNVPLRTDITPPDASLVGDRDLTVRVLTNLLSNALKFSPSGAEIAVSVSPREDGSVRFSVKDQGPGIPENWAKKVFDKYAQVEARKQGAAVGTGLGLTFCRLAVEAQGGRIWLECEVGQGATFIFTLPANGKSQE
jgi:signal transduction histidine kinase